MFGTRLNDGYQGYYLLLNYDPNRSILFFLISLSLEESITQLSFNVEQFLKDIRLLVVPDWTELCVICIEMKRNSIEDMIWTSQRM